MTPKSEISGWHGGSDNSLTRLVIKPTHLIGGYGQLVLRVQLLRPDRQPARRDRRHPAPLPGGRVLMRVMAQMCMVMNLDKCIGCHTCSVTCKQTWTNRPGTEYVYFNNVETKPGTGYPKPVRGPGAVEGRLDAGPQGTAAAQGGRPAATAAVHLLQPRPAHDRRLRRPVDVRLPDAHPGAGRDADPERALDLRAHRQGHDACRWGSNWDDDLAGGPAHAAGDPDLAGLGRGGEAGVRAGLHVLPAADLRALPEPVLRRLLPLRRDVQARGGRDRAGRPGPLPRLAVLRVGLPV